MNKATNFKVGDRVHYDGLAEDGDWAETGVIDEIDEDGILHVTAEFDVGGCGTHREWDPAISGDNLTLVS